MMTLRLKFILAVGLLHGVLVALAFSLRTTNPVLFGAAEVLLVVSGVLTYQLYRGFVRPFQLIAAGTEAIRAGDFTLKFVPVGQHEMDQLIGVYNAMIDHLRHERVQQHEKSYLLQQLIDASPAGILLLDFDGRITAINPAGAAALQLPATALRGLAPADLPGEWGVALASDDVRDAALALTIPRACRERARTAVLVGAAVQGISLLGIAFGVAPPALAPVAAVLAAGVALAIVREPTTPTPAP